MADAKKDLEEILKCLYIFRTFLGQNHITNEQRTLYERHYTYNIRRVETLNRYEHSFHVVWYDAYFLRRLGVEPYAEQKYFPKEENKKEE